MILYPLIFPGVELNKVDAFQAQIFKTGGHILVDVIGRKAVIEREFAATGPLEILGGILVATWIFRSGLFRTNHPNNFSLWPPPYAQAVSKKLHPRFNAFCRESLDAASSEPVHPPMPH